MNPEVKKTLNWTYVRTAKKTIFFSNFCNLWKKKMIKQTLAYTHNKLNQDLEKFMKNQKHISIFNLSDHELEDYKRFNLKVQVPQYSYIEKRVKREKIGMCKYIVSCEISCHILLKLS